MDWMLVLAMTVSTMVGLLLGSLLFVLLKRFLERKRNQLLADAEESARRLRELMPGDDDIKHQDFGPLDHSLAREAKDRCLCIDEHGQTTERTTSIDTSDAVEDAINSMGGPRL